jgi:TolA-binding protein
MKHPALTALIIGIALIFTMIAAQYIAYNPQAVAQAIAPAGTHASISPQARYQVIDDIVTLQARIDALDARVKELEWRQAYDRQQMALARTEDQKRITSLEVTGAMWGMCR